MVLAVPTQDTFTVGEVLTAALMNKNVRDGVNFLANPPIAVLYQGTAQSCPNASESAVTFDTEVVDSYGGHSTTSNTSRYTAQVAGWYFAIGGVWFGSNSTGYRRMDLYVNGSAISPPAQETTQAVAGTGTAVQVEGLFYLNVGDYVEVMAYQNSGAALGYPPNTNTLQIFWVHA